MTAKTGKIGPEERTLLLSLYLDGELSGEQLATVEEKLRSAPEWREEYQSLRTADDRITKAVKTNWHDEEFTTKVRLRLRVASPPSGSAHSAVEEPAAAAQKAEKPPRWGLAVLFLSIVFFVLLLLALLLKYLT